MLKRQLALLVPTRARLVSCAAVLLIAFASVSDALAQIQIVNCDAPVQSRKRGIGIDTKIMTNADFEAVAPGVSWYYDWGSAPTTVPNDVKMDFIPMAWNNDPSFQTQITSYLAAGNRPWRVFAINEPNLKGQAFMTPSNTAVTFEQVKAICAPYNIPVISPHMAEGSASNQSITAYDPIQMTNVTYTSPIPFLYAFLYYCGGTNPAGVSTHSYGGYGDLKYWTSTMHNDWPTQTVWVTEFNASGATSDAQVLATLIPAVDYCESTPWIEGYSWFMSQISGDPYNSLLVTGSPGVLTAAGQVYVQMPVHQTNIFYLIPGRLAAARYVTTSQMSIAPTTDVSGFANMQSTAAGGSLDYNIQVPAAGTYPLNVRVSHAGQVQFYENGTLLGTATATLSGWATVSTTVALPAGTQTLHVVLSANGQLLNWIDFLATNGTPSVPDNLAASGSTGQVVLTWSPAAGATGYRIKMSTTNGGPYTLIANQATTGYTNAGLGAGVTYYYVVSATNTAGESSNSIQVSATTPSSSPAAPAILTATANFGQVSLTWSAVATATNYNVKRSTTSGAETTIASTASTNYTDSSVINGTKYYYVVSAVNSGGESPNSAEVSATPLSSSSGAVALINFAGTNTYIVASPDGSGHYWNNIGSGLIYGAGLNTLTNHGLGTHGTSLPLVDTANGNDGWTLSISNWSGSGIQGDFHNYGSGSTPYSNNLTAIWPLTALEDGLEVHYNTGNPGVAVYLSGLNASDTYNVLLYGYEPGQNTPQTNVLAGGSSASPSSVTFTNLEYNTNTFAQWTNITPTASGQIVVTINVGANYKDGALNAMEVAQNVPAALGGISSGAINRNSLTLNWMANANIHLQSATNLTLPVVWTDVPNTTGQGSATITATNSRMFFRLVQP